MVVLMGEVGDCERVYAEFFLRGGEGWGNGEIDVLAWVEGCFAFAGV